MFQKKKKFTAEISPEQRLSDRWDQQVFFITKKYPQSEDGISKIKKRHEKKLGTPFAPSEEALLDLANLYTELQDVL